MRDMFCIRMRVCSLGFGANHNLDIAKIDPFLLLIAKFVTVAHQQIAHQLKLVKSFRFYRICL